jgi:hypothetical protein
VLFDGRLRAEVEPEPLREETGPEIEKLAIEAPLVAKHLEGVGRQGLEKVDLARAEAEEPRVLIGHDLENQTLEPRDPTVVIRGPVVVAVPLEDDSLARDMLYEDEGAEPDDAPNLGSETGIGGERLPLQALSQEVRRKNGEAVEDALDHSRPPGKSEGHRRLVDDLNTERLPVDLRRLDERAPGRRLVESLESEGHVLGAEGIAVSEAHSLSQVKDERRPFRGELP